MTSQRDIFLSGEADRYFARNRSDYEASAPARTEALDFYQRFIRKGDPILEIGCANGLNLHYLREKTSCVPSGIDPSSQAVSRGKAAFPELDLRVGTADVLPFPDESMNFVLFGFCLYLVDRKLLARVVSEADRVLREGGFLAITDFDPPQAKVRAYRHASGTYSYKMDYSRLFLGNPAYALVEKLRYSHSRDGVERRSDDRLSATVLSKDTEKGYAFEEDRP